MKKTRSLLLAGATAALAAVIAIGGSLAYYTDRDAATNVFTVGNVDIELNEEFEQDAELVPGVRIEKEATITNTGKNDAWVWMTVAVPAVLDDENADLGSANVLHWNMPGCFWNGYHNQDKYIQSGITDGYLPEGSTGVADEDSWINDNKAVKQTIEGIEYNVYTFKYVGAITPGETTNIGLSRAFLDENVDIAPDGQWYNVENGVATKINWNSNTDGNPKIYVAAYAIQEDMFDTVDAAYAAYGKQWGTNSNVDYTPTVRVTPRNIETVDFTAENETYTLSGDFSDVAIAELGEGSVLAFDNATVGVLSLADDAVLTGSATIDSVKSARGGSEPVELTITNGDFDITNELGVRNTDGKSILNIENSNVDFGTIFVGEHTGNYKSAVAEFNVINSYLSGEEGSLGSTIAVWGKSGVSAKIYDSEIYTYSRGWHQSEDANDNSLTFQGTGNIDVDIQRSNMHLYGARSIINARQYGNEETTIDFTIDESLIWVVTKSNHGDTTLPVWNTTEITDSALLFTKNVHQSTPAVFKSFVYGNPVIHGNYAVTTQCQWDADIVLADGQTVTFAKGANVSIYDGAGNVRFVCSDPAQVIVEDGATLTNIGVN